MLNAIIEWYIDSSFRIITGQMIFFSVIAFWAWKERGRTHFLTEVGMYITAILAFSTEEKWAFALLSMAIWMHVGLIVREIVQRESENER